MYDRSRKDFTRYDRDWILGLCIYEMGVSETSEGKKYAQYIVQHLKLFARMIFYMNTRQSSHI